jgi:hypothetical protein
MTADGSLKPSGRRAAKMMQRVYLGARSEDIGYLRTTWNLQDVILPLLNE